MKTSYQILLITLLSMFVISGQARQTQSSNASSDNLRQDTSQVNQLLDLAEKYYFTKPDSCLFFSEKAMELAQKLGFRSGEVTALNKGGEALRFLGDYPKALEMQFDALKINETQHDLEGQVTTLGFIGFTFVELGEYRQGLDFLFRADKANVSLSNKMMHSFNLSNIGDAYQLMNMPDSALLYLQQAYTLAIDLPMAPLKSLTLTRLGIVNARMGKDSIALVDFRKALRISYLFGDKVNISKIQYRIASSYLSENRYDSSLYYARSAFAYARATEQKSQMLDASNLLAQLFRKSNLPDSIIFYQDVSMTVKDSLFGPKKLKQLQVLMLSQQQQQKQIEQDQRQYKDRIKTLSLTGIIGFFLILAIILFRNNRHEKQVNNKLQKTLADLKSTQKQLVQSEKMASLGELTAGIAHEIQNPLNFVNNFSQVSAELLVEMKDELAEGNNRRALSIADDVNQNLEKILHHGKRADSIVKAMLQHSQSISGVQEPTNINRLADEYLRIAFQGSKAKDSTFNAIINTNFDEAIGIINIVPQNIGKVLFNLYNNAFYTVSEKKKRLGDAYEPTISVSTKKLNGKIEIKVNDNGVGIPEKERDKIFLPFFTTKPTGQGTGLGLSLSYDLVKANGGEIKMESEEGKGSTFIIQLPVV